MKLVLVSDTKKQIETCKGCVFDNGNECKDEDFKISNSYGFIGGCDNPNLKSGIFVFYK